MLKTFICVSFLYLSSTIILPHDSLQITQEELQQFKNDLLYIHSRLLYMISECSQDLNDQDLFNRYTSDQTSEEEKLKIITFCSRYLK